MYTGLVCGESNTILFVYSAFQSDRFRLEVHGVQKAPLCSVRDTFFCFLLPIRVVCRYKRERKEKEKKEEPRWIPTGTSFFFFFSSFFPLHKEVVVSVKSFATWRPNSLSQTTEVLSRGKENFLKDTWPSFPASPRTGFLLCELGKYTQRFRKKTTSNPYVSSFLF